MNIDKFNLLEHQEILQVSDAIEKNHNNKISKINFINYSDIKNEKDNIKIQLIGSVKSIKKGITKKGNFFGIVTMVYNNEELEQHIFYEQIINLFKLDLNIPIVFTMKTKIPEFGIAMKIIDFKSIVKI